MIPGSWVGVSLVMALLIALMQLASQFFKVQAIHMLFWVRLMAVIVMSPIVFFIPAPVSPLYYTFVVMASLMFAYTDLYVFGLSAKSGAGLVTRLGPLSVIVTFILWTMITPSLAVKYIQNPLQTAGITLAMLLGVFFTLRLRKCRLSWDTLKIMARPILLSGVAVIFSKTAMNHADDLHSGVFYYPLIQGLTVWLSYVLVLRTPALMSRMPHFDFQSGLFSKRVMLAGVVAGSAHLLSTIMKYYGISLAENPAYVTMIGLTAPLWVLVVYRFVSYKEEADVLSGLGVVFAVLVLIASTQLL